MKVGFTGTRDGMTRSQASRLQHVLALLFHADRHVGRRPTLLYGTHETVELKADAEAARLAEALGYELQPYNAARGRELERDRELVIDADILTAAPKTDREVRRSGTWATVRYGRQKGIAIVMLPRGRE